MYLPSELNIGEFDMFDFIDATGTARKDDPRMRDVEREMIRSHALCLKISSKKPTDLDYKALLEELFQCAIDDSVAIVSPFYCDCGCRMKLGKNIIIKLDDLQINTLLCQVIFYKIKDLSVRRR